MQETHLFVPPRSGEEQVRLSDHQRAIQRLMGLLPPGMDTLSHALHLFCGGGDWCLEVANRYRIPCVSLDTRKMIAIARSYAQVAERDDLTSFEEMQGPPLPFPDETFDVVYAHDLSSVLPREQWSDLLKECARLLKEGGYLVLGETLFPTTTRPASTQLTHRLLQACWKAGLGLSEEGSLVETVHRLRTYLESHFQRIRIEAHLFSDAFVIENFWQLTISWQPFLTTMGEGSQDELFRLCDQSADEGIKD